MTENQIRKSKYFAAANGFSGFVSYFDKVFDPSELCHLYILKGGPGTGKSSLMRRVSDRFSDETHEIEEIYCSSDPKSLDGVIIKRGECRIAIIDGTAPHEYDTKIPGAYDSLINLGENWDKRWLIGNREKIKTLNKEKKTAYKTAYTHLKMAEPAFEYLKSTHEDSFDHDKSKKAAKELLKSFKAEKVSKKTIRLISAFGKDGEFTLDTITSISEKTIKIGGDPFNAYIFLNILKDVANTKNMSYQYSPTPLSKDLCEAIYFPGVKLGIYGSKEASDINADEFLISKKNTKLASISKAKEIVDLAKEEAVRWFKIASDFHFRLEDIYSKAMDFTKNDAAVSKLIDEIEIILEGNK